MCSYHNHDVNVVYDFYATLLSSTNKEGVLPGTKFESAKYFVLHNKCYSWFIIQQIKECWMKALLYFLVFNKNKLS